MFVNRYIIDKKRYFKWVRESSFSGVQLGFFIFWVIMAVCGGVFLLLDSAPIGYVLTAFCIYRAFFRWYVIAKVQYKRLTEMIHKKEWERQVVLGDEYVEVTDETMSSKYRYEDITEIKENGNEVKIIGKKKFTIRLYADCFLDSTWDECKDFINNRRAL